MALNESNNLRDLPRPPLDKGWPFLGHALSLANNFGGFIKDKYLEHGPIFRLRAANQELVIMAGVEANLFANRKGKEYFRSKEFWQKHDDEFGATRSLISEDGPYHAKMRGLQKRAYSRGNATKHFDTIINIAREQIRAWPIDEPIIVQSALQRLVTEQLGIIAANYAPKENLDHIIRFVRTNLAVNISRQRPQFLLNLPQYQKAKEQTLDMGRKIIEIHKQESTDRHIDLVDNMLVAAQEDPEFIPEHDQLLFVLGPYVAGLDTAASTTAFMMYALLTHPDILDRVINECDSLMAAGIPDPKAFRSLDVTARAFQETLRLYPIAPAMTRTATQDFEFQGYLVQKGDQVVVGTTVPHQLPQFYPNPDRFDIDRYLPDRKENKKPGVFAPFGIGSHTCLGAGFAEILINLNMAVLLTTVDLEMVDPHYNLKVDPIPTPSPDKNFKIRVIKHR